MCIKFIPILTALILTSCGDKTAPANDTKCIDPEIKPIYYETLCQGDSCNFVHDLMLSAYDDRCFNDYDFVYLADKYLDTVKTSLPVAAIEFCKPFEFKDIGGSENDEQLQKNAITCIWYTWEGKPSKVPEISHISIWLNGQRKDLDYLHIKSRRQRMEVYNNKK